MIPPIQMMQAHQFLYYVGPHPIWSDFDYDRFCQLHSLDGNGGSDRASDYSLDVKRLASNMVSNPGNYPPPE